MYSFRATTSSCDFCGSWRVRKEKGRGARRSWTDEGLGGSHPEENPKRLGVLPEHLALRRSRRRLGEKYFLALTVKSPNDIAERDALVLMGKASRRLVRSRGERPAGGGSLAPKDVEAERNEVAKTVEIERSTLFVNLQGEGEVKKGTREVYEGLQNADPPERAFEPR
jgi:hypothetical protein